MRRSLRRIASLAALPAAGILMVASSPRVVNAASTQPPVITRVSPQVLVENGQPLKLTLSGSGLSAVTTVFLSPVVADRSFIAFNDTTLLVTLPASLTPGEYSVTVNSPAGSTDAGAAVFSVRAFAPPVSSGGGSGPVTIPQYSFDPYPAGAAHGSAVSAAPGVGAAAQQPVLLGTVTSGNQLSDPVLVAAVGAVAGALMYLLWGRPGRIEMARRRDFLAQLVIRPVQRLHLGRICLQCGRLHWVFRTRRDLWRAGEYCSAFCFVTAQDEDLSAQRSHSHGVGRLRGLGVYAELERKLSLIFAAEAAAVGHVSNLFAAESSAPTADALFASWTVADRPAPVEDAVTAEDPTVQDAGAQDADTEETVDADVEVHGTATPAADPAPAAAADDSTPQRRRRGWWPWSRRASERDAQRAVDVEDGGPTLLPYQADDLDDYDAAIITAADRAAELVDFDIVAVMPSAGDAEDDRDPTQSILGAATLTEAARIVERVTRRRRRAATYRRLFEPVIAPDGDETAVEPADAEVMEPATT